MLPQGPGTQVTAGSIHAKQLDQFYGAIYQIFTVSLVLVVSLLCTLSVVSSYPNPKYQNKSMNFNKPSISKEGPPTQMMSPLKDRPLLTSLLFSNG